NNPEGSLIKKGELATFILVSDEEEHDISGTECVKSYKFQQPLPGTLYRGICADDEASTYYEIPDKRDWKLEVKKPYIKNIRQAQEHINSQINKVDGQCAVNFRQSYARLKVLKNTHKVRFSRKISNADGSTYIKSWSHDLNFNRVNKKYTFTFDRKSLKHKVKFDRTSVKHQVSANRKLTTPVYSVAISRDLISKYQSVNYVRKVILTKEGSKQVEVSNSGTLNIKIPGVNISASDCTASWLAARAEIKALEVPLSSSSESYSYSVSSCAIANTTKLESFAQNYSGIKPLNCDVNFAELVFPKSVMQSNDEYKYSNITCTQLANNVVSYSFNSNDISGEAPTGASCNAIYAAAKDSSKPTVNTSLGQELTYESVVCASSNSTSNNVELTGFPGNCSLVGDLLSYIKLKDGSLANVSYANTSCVDTNVTSLAQTRTELGTYSGSSCADSIKSLEGNLTNTVYENCSVALANVTDSYQSIKGIPGQYTYTNDANLITYIRVKDGNKSVDSTDYNLTSINIVGREKYVNIPVYADDVAQYSLSIDGKIPAVCDLNYASLKDTAKPSLGSGQYLVYYDVSCIANAQTNYQLARGDQVIKYDGSYGNLLLPYESSLESVIRDCNSTEKSTLISSEASKSPALVIDGNILEFSSCKVSNSALSTATTESNNILKLINADSNVLVGTNSSVCSTAITSYCAPGATNNPNGYYGCLNNAASFVPYVAFKAEKRKYVLKPPIFLSDKKELHWFGFEPIQITTISGATQTISLLSYFCEDVVGACESDSIVNKMSVENYFKQKYASGDENVWSSIKKVSFSDQTVSDPSSLAIACSPDTLIDYSGSSDARKDYDICNNKSVNASKSFDIVYDLSLSNIVVTKNINDAISCDEVCTTETCKAKDGSRELIPIITNDNGVARALTMKEFYGGNCSVNPN
ncbi:MAG: hypothetical protein L6Q37_14975, partial [Bdellovibrionaceae bacterium]|nr:hypothetical protein [Pseudobdellovibrionaceae bacterium]